MNSVIASIVRSLINFGSDALNEFILLKETKFSVWTLKGPRFGHSATAELGSRLGGFRVCLE